jgi:hypothetical protein
MPNLTDADQLDNFRIAHPTANLGLPTPILRQIFTSPTTEAIKTIELIKKSSTSQNN